jgi:hypothetical protein
MGEARDVARGGAGAPLYFIKKIKFLDGFLGLMH